MTPMLKKVVILLSLLSGAGVAQAGSPDGLNIAAVADAAALPYTSALKQFLADEAADGIKCGQYALRLQNVYSTELPPQLTGELALAAVKNKAKHKKLGKILTGFRSKTLERGLDGVLAFEVRGAQLRLYGISGAADEQIIVSTLPVSQATDQKKFNLAACKALASLPVLAEP